MKTNSTYDVVIIGAGVAGCATAIALKSLDASLRIAILERNAFDNTKQRIGETLPPHASQQLQHLGIWDSFLSCRFLSSYGTSAAWGSPALHTNEFLYSPFGYGWILDRNVFDWLMIDEANKRGIEFFFNSTCIEAFKIETGWYLDCISEKNRCSISARFTVDATGKKAAFASMQGVEKIAHDQLVGIYRHYALTDNITDALGKGTLVETDAFGWWYSAAIPNNRLVVGYMSDADIANELQLRRSNNFDDILSKTNFTRKRLHQAVPISAPIVLAAHTQSLSSAVGDCWLAVGDAASSYDPISSLGIFKSLTTSRFASFAIMDHLSGNPEGLKKYQRIISRDFEEYENKKQAYYNQETRFKNQSFWNRRHKPANQQSITKT